MTICQLDQRLGARPGAEPRKHRQGRQRKSCASTSVSLRSKARRAPQRAAARENVSGSRSNSASRIASASSSPTGPGSSATSARICAAVHRSLARRVLGERPLTRQRSYEHMFAGGGKDRQRGSEGTRHRSPRGVGARTAPPILATPARRSSDWRPARPAGSRTAGLITNRLTDRAVGAWPGSGHVRTPPQGAADGRQAHQPPAQLSPSPGQPHRPDVHLPDHVAEASREIERLKQAQPSTRASERRDRAKGHRRRESPAAEQDATRVQPREVTGYGSSATWAHHREPHPPAATRPVNRRPLPTVGRRQPLRALHRRGC